MLVWIVMETTMPDGKDAGEIDDVNQSVSDALWKTHRTIYVSSLALGIGLVVLIAICLIVFDPWSTSATQNDGSLICALIPLLIPLAINLYYTQKFKREMMVQIAQSLGYAYQEKMSLDGFSGRIFTTGHGQNASNCMSGDYKGFPFRIFSFGYVTGYGKSAQGHFTTVFALTYPKLLPHVLMNPPGSTIGNLIELSDMEQVELEGAFSDSCKLYVAKGNQVEVREIFQPDTMQEMLSTFAASTLEIFGTGVYLMQAGSFDNRKIFFEMLANVDSLIDTLLPGLESVSNKADAAAPAMANSSTSAAV